MLVMSSKWWFNSFSHPLMSAALAPLIDVFSSILFFILFKIDENLLTMFASYSSFKLLILSCIPSTLSQTSFSRFQISFMFFSYAFTSYPAQILNSLCRSSICRQYSCSHFMYQFYLLKRSSWSLPFSPSIWTTLLANCWKHSSHS